MNFEYLINEVLSDSFAMIRDMQECGAKGWELVAVRDTGNGFVQLVYKKAKT